jgi:hypothetical protein
MTGVADGVGDARSRRKNMNKSSLKRFAVGAVIAAVVLGGGALAYGAVLPARSSVDAQLSAALAADPGSDPGAQGTAPSQADRRAARRGGKAGLGAGLRLGAVAHGDLIVRTKDGTFQSVTIDRGKVQSVEGDKLTIVRPDGPTVVVTVDANTKYRGVSGPQELTEDTRVGVASRDGKALLVRVSKAAPPGAKKGS